jgi:hypothetical protein
MIGDAAGESALGRLRASRASALQAAKFSAFGTDVGPVAAARSSAAMMGVMIPPRHSLDVATDMPAA